MRPLSMVIHNVRSHERTSIQFAHPLCFVFGHNGSGKSTIAEALRWVLCGHTREHTVEELLSSASSQLEVSLVFRIEESSDSSGTEDEGEYHLRRSYTRGSGEEIYLIAPDQESLCGDDARRRLENILGISRRMLLAILDPLLWFEELAEMRARLLSELASLEWTQEEILAHIDKDERLTGVARSSFENLIRSVRIAVGRERLRAEDLDRANQVMSDRASTNRAELSRLRERLSGLCAHLPDEPRGEGQLRALKDAIAEQEGAVGDLDRSLMQTHEELSQLQEEKVLCSALQSHRSELIAPQEVSGADRELVERERIEDLEGKIEELETELRSRRRLEERLEILQSDRAVRTDILQSNRAQLSHLEGLEMLEGAIARRELLCEVYEPIGDLLDRLPMDLIEERLSETVGEIQEQLDVICGVGGPRFDLELAEGPDLKITAVSDGIARPLHGLTHSERLQIGLAISYVMSKQTGISMMIADSLEILIGEGRIGLSQWVRGLSDDLQSKRLEFLMTLSSVPELRDRQRDGISILWVDESRVCPVEKAQKPQEAT